jgi:hypothetical protein
MGQSRIPLPIAPSVLTHLQDEPEAVYHAKRRDFLASHALGEFRRNPLLFRKKELGLVTEEERPAFIVGRAVHCRVLEGRGVFDDRYVVGGPVNPKTGRCFGPDTKAFSEWAAQQSLPVVSEETAALCERLAQAVGEHELANTMLALGRAEGVIRGTYHDVACQARLDWFNPEYGIIDLKTVDNLDWLEMESRSFSYAHQLAFYRSVCTAVSGLTPEAYLVAVEKREPYRVGVWHFSEQVLDAAARDNAAAIERLKICRKTDRWLTGYESIRTLDYV